MTARQPAEWVQHQAVWTAWPSHPELWEENLEPARAEVAALIHAIDAEGRGERVELLAATEDAVRSAEAAVAGTRTRVHHVPFGDIWLRDTGPIFLKGEGGIIACDPGFNGWGGKYVLEHDEEVAGAVARLARVPVRAVPWILEGGAIDVDGTGLAVTTEQCLLNPNRNPGFSRVEVEARLADDLGISHVLWLGDGLMNDHTDGHVDNLARFVGEGRLALPEAAGADDPNAAVYADARARAKAYGLEIVSLPSPGKVMAEGKIIPASYMNFYIANTVVVVPTYGCPNDAAAVAAVQDLFPEHRAIGLPANHILTGGGSFHCITQQVPVL